MKYKSVVDELKINFKEHFETEFATKLLQSQEILKIVNKVSYSILQLILTNKQTVIEVANANSKIAEELFEEDYFGHFAKNAEAKPNGEEIFNLISNQLTNPDADLIHSMQIHCIFIQRIYDSLPFKKIATENNNIGNKQEYVQKIFAENLFNRRGRQEISVTNKLSTNIGINRNIFFKNKAANTDKHFPAINKFIPTKDSEYFKLTTENSLPFVSGPSGHTGSLLLLGSLCGLDLAELNLYALACFAFLAAGGNHSFHEIMIVAKNLGLPFTMGNYEISIPLSIKKSSLYNDLKELFPNFLTENENLQEKDYVL